jgi:hypothetical protein
MNTGMQDEAGILVDDSLPPNTSHPGPFEQAVQAVKNLIMPTHKELITQLRQATPIKVRQTFQVPASGNIGGNGAMSPDYSAIVYTSPLSTEAWLHRITITSPQHSPGAPLTAGAIALFGTTFGEVIQFAPDAPQANTLPIQFIEGRSSAPHLDRGESLVISGGGLTAGDTIIVDLQVILVTGASEYTPRAMSPSDMTKSESLLP